MDRAVWWLTTICSASLAASLAALLLYALSRARALKLPPRWLRAAWIAVIVCLLLPLRWDWAGRPALRLTIAPASIAGPSIPAAGARESEPAANAPTPAARADARRGWPHILHTIWLLGAALTYAVLLARHVRALRLLRRWQSAANARVQALFAREARALDLAGRVRLACSEATQTPILTGLLRPTLYLPSGPAHAGRTEEQLTDMLRHELIHAASHDLWLRALFLLARALHWFNPMLLLMDREFTLHTEMAADARLTARAEGARRLQYAQMVLDSARGPSVRAPMTMYFMGGKQAMKRRIDGIMNGHRERLGALALALAILALTLAPTVVAETAAPNLAPPMASPAWIGEGDEEALARLTALLLADYGLSAESLPASEEAAALMQALSEGTYFTDSLQETLNALASDEGVHLMLRLASFELMPILSQKLAEGAHDLSSHLAAALYRDYMTSLTQGIEAEEIDDDGSLAYMRAQLLAWESTLPAQVGE